MLLATSINKETIRQICYHMEGLGYGIFNIDLFRSLMTISKIQGLFVFVFFPFFSSVIFSISSASFMVARQLHQLGFTFCTAISTGQKGRQCILLFKDARRCPGSP